MEQHDRRTSPGLPVGDPRAIVVVIEPQSHHHWIVALGSPWPTSTTNSGFWSIEAKFAPGQMLRNFRPLRTRNVIFT